MWVCKKEKRKRGEKDKRPTTVELLDLNALFFFSSRLA